HIQFVLPHAKADRPGNTSCVVRSGEQMCNGYALVEIALTQRLAGRLSSDGLDGLPMDGDLPAANALVLAVVFLPDGQAPLFQQVHRGVYMPPPMIRISHSTVSVLGNAIDCVLWM